MSSLKPRSINGTRSSRAVIITDPEILASLRPSRECMDRCAELERMTMRRGRRNIIMI